MDFIKPDFGLFFWQSITLVCVLMILKKFAWKPILHTIQAREHYIATALHEAEQAKQEITQLQAAQQQLIEQTSIACDKMMTEALAAKAVLLEEAKKEAHQLSTTILEKANATIAKEKEAASYTLKSEMAFLAVQIAEKLLQKELHQSATQEAVLHQLMQKVP